MSLINQMLQDLEKRQPGGETHPLSAVRAATRYRKVRYFWPLLLLLVAAAGALAWQLLQAPASFGPAPQPLTAAAPLPAAALPAAIEPESRPMPESPPETSAEPAAVSGPAVDAPASRPPVLSGLKESTELSFMPRPAEPAPKTAGLPPPPAAKKLPPATSQVAPIITSDAATPANVTKQVRQLTPSQRAENEYRKALSLVQQGRVAEATDALSLALQQDARHAAARQTLIGLLIEARRFGEAERRLQEGLSLDRAQPELAMTLARLQVERGDTDAAITTLERSQSHAADRADYQAFMAALLQRQGRHGEAIEHYRQALRRSPSAVWQMGLGISLQAENRYQEAREAFSRARAANTLSPELQAFVEQRLRQLGQ